MNWDISTTEGMKNAEAWQRSHLTRINEGGVWAVPRSGTTYTISHKKKTAVRQGGFMLEPGIDKVFRSMGWTVEEKK